MTQNDNSEILWRYIDLYKLLDMLQHKRLPFVRLDKMGDPYEGMGTQRTVNLFERCLREGIDVARVTEALGLYRRPKRFLANCWHRNRDESQAMWKLYADKGIAIRTSETRLLDSICCTRNGDRRCAEVRCQSQGKATAKCLWFDAVRYGDIERELLQEGYDNNKLRTFPPFLFKDQSFAHEREYRLVIDWSDDGPDDVTYLPVDLTTLITKVILHPLMQPWEIDVIKAHFVQVGITVEVTPSRLPRPR